MCHLRADRSLCLLIGPLCLLGHLCLHMRLHNPQPLGLVRSHIGRRLRCGAIPRRNILYNKAINADPAITQAAAAA